MSTRKLFDLQEDFWGHVRYSSVDQRAGPPVPYNLTGTGLEAAESVRPAVSEFERRVYEFVVSRGVVGATDEQIQEALGISGNTERPRRLSLERKGYLRDSGLRRPTRSGRMAVVWVATDRPVPPK